MDDTSLFFTSKNFLTSRLGKGQQLSTNFFAYGRGETINCHFLILIRILLTCLCKKKFSCNNLGWKNCVSWFRQIQSSKFCLHSVIWNLTELEPELYNYTVRETLSFRKHNFGWEDYLQNGEWNPEKESIILGWFNRTQVQKKGWVSGVDLEIYALNHMDLKRY